MKHTTFQFLSFASMFVFCVALAYLEFPSWVILTALVPFGYVQLYASNQFSFRDSLKFEPIPDNGYQNRINYLDTKRSQFEQLGFEKVDEFYLSTSSDIVGYIYRREGLPITLVDYDFQVAKLTEIYTRYDNGYSLTTSTRYSGVVPPRKNGFIQAVHGATVENLLAAHRDSHKYLENEEFRASRLQWESFAKYFINAHLEQGKWLRGLSAPAVTLYRMIRKKGRDYAQPIRSQIQAGTSVLPQE